MIDIDEKQLKFITYCRKSSDSEDKQILSLPAQVRELTDFAKKNGLKIIDTYQESQSAFKIGRPYFNEMLARIASGEANAILVWQANRIARNSKDSGDFIYLIDEGKLLELRTPSKSYYNTPNDKFTLSIEFTMAKKDSDDKSENVKRGNREKFFQRKQWIGPAKQGYLNYTDQMTKEKKIIKDKKRFNLLQKAGKLILEDSYTPMQAFYKLNNDWGYRTRKTARQGGKPMGKSSFYKFLSDPYYYGLMVRREGKTFGKHPRMFTKEEFDRMQIILGRKGRPQVTKHEFAFKEVLRCGECGGSITCEEKWQIICPICKTKFNKGKKTFKCKNCGTLIEEMKKPKILHYIYYHCTKKINPNCSQGSISLDKLEKQVNKELKRYEISERFKGWAIEYLNELNDKETNDRELVRANIKANYDDCVKKLDNLLKLKISPQNVDGSVISEEEYNSQRKYLLQEKENLLEKINDTNQRINNWHELSAKTFNFACYARYWFAKGDLKTKTQILGALGSNLKIKDRNILIDGQKHFFIIEKGKKDLEILAKKFEPVKWLELLEQKELPEVFRSCWLRGRDSNPD